MRANSDTQGSKSRLGRNGKEPPADKRWKKGQSGNPSGRPKKQLDTEKLARAHAEKAIDALVDVVTNKKAVAVARVQAAQALLDRGFGRPTQAVKAEHTLTLNEAFEDVLREVNAERRREHIDRQMQIKLIEGSVEHLPAE